MRVHLLQHVPFEGPAHLADWAGARGHTLAITRLYIDEALPALADFDRLITLGGPMGVGDTADHPWLAAERELLGTAIAAGKSVVGICLGAQQIAAALGAEVRRNAQREIGWFGIRLTQEAQALPLCAGCPERFTVLHWHGDTFALPAGAIRLASSDACAEQGFLYDGRVLALQCHLEATPESVAALCQHAAEDLRAEGPFVQDAPWILAPQPQRDARMHAVLDTWLDRLPAFRY